MSARLMLTVNNLPSGVLTFTFVAPVTPEPVLSSYFFPSLQIHVVFKYDPSVYHCTC